MALFPQSFIDDLRKSQADIVQVIQDEVPLKRAGTTTRGCARSTARRRRRSTSTATRASSSASGAASAATSSSSSSCTSKLRFPEAVRQLAQRFGLQVPELERSGESAAEAAERETLLKLHEAAAAYFREQLAAPAGAPGAAATPGSAA